MNNLKPTREYASVWTRLGSFVIDGLIVAPFSIAMLVLLGRMNGNSDHDGLYFYYILLLFIGLFCVGFGNNVVLMGKTGQSLGRKFLHIAVLDWDGNPIGIGKAFYREVIGRWVSSLFFYLGFLWAFWDKDKQMWHDKMAKSFVFYVEDESEQEEVKIPGPDTTDMP